MAFRDPLDLAAVFLFRRFGASCVPASFLPRFRRSPARLPGELRSDSGITNTPYRNVLKVGTAGLGAE